MKQVFPWLWETRVVLHRIYPGRREAFDYLNRAVKAAGYVPGEEIRFAMDAAASELWDETRGAYYFPGESRMKGKEILPETEEMIRYYQTLPERAAPSGPLKTAWMKMTGKAGDA